MMLGPLQNSLKGQRVVGLLSYDLSRILPTPQFQLPSFLISLPPGFLLGAQPGKPFSVVVPSQRALHLVPQ